MPIFRRNDSSQTPSAEEIDAAGRQLQQGGLLGRGSSRRADKLIARAGDDSQNVAFAILNAAADYEPR
jgi:hypothetical protein